MLFRFQRRFYVLVFFSILNVVILIGLENNLNFFSNVIYASTNFVRMSTGNVIGFFVRITDIVKTNTHLRTEVENLSAEVSFYREQLLSVDSLLYENQRLRELVQFSFSTDNSLIAAKIIGSARSDGSGEFIINKGSNSKLEPNMIVCGIYQRKLVVLGKIVRVGQNSAVFQSIYKSGFSIPILTALSNQEGFLIGMGLGKSELKIVFNSIYESKYVFTGEEILLNEYSTLFPQAIPIGVVSNLVSNEEDLLIRADVAPYLSPNNLDIVMVVVPKVIENIELDSEGLDTTVGEGAND